MSNEKELTVRELEILKLIALGKTNHLIAEQLIISEYTVETHRKNINTKLGANSTATMLLKAHQSGLI